MSLIKIDQAKAAETQAAQAQANRQAAYSTESDPLKLTIEEDALRAGTDPDYTPWLALKDEIRARFPYPEA